MPAGRPTEYNACCPHWYRGIDTITCSECGNAYKPPKALSKDEIEYIVGIHNNGTSKS